MITIDLDSRGNTPLYEFIYKSIRKDILDGVLKAGEKLPSKRVMAENLAVSIITIENAYDQLIFEGYIEAIQKKGYFVANIEAPQKAEQSKKNESINKSKVVSNNPLVIDFSSNHVSADYFPYSTWTKIMRRTLLDYEGEMLKKSENIGAYKLREAISDYLRQFRGMDVNPDNIVIGAGMEYLYSLVVQLMGRTRMIAVEDPGHTKVSKVYESNGIRVVYVPIDKDGFMLDKLVNPNVSAIHITPSHHFPTGVVMPASRRHKIIEYAKRENIVVIEDDYDSELRFEGHPIPTMASFAPENVIYMNTFSKTLMNSVRMAYMVLPDRLMELYRKRLGFYSCTVSSLEQYTLAEFISKGYYERFINRMRLNYRRFRECFIECFNSSKLSSKARLIENKAGLHFLLEIKGDVNEEKISRKLENEGIIIKSLKSYCNRPNDEYKNLFIINYYDEEKLKLIKAFDEISREI